MPIKTNFDKFAIDLKRKSENFIKEVEQIVGVNIGDMELMAIRDAPGGGDLIKTQFGTQTQDEIRGQRNWSPISQQITSKEQRDGNVYRGILQVNRDAGEIAAWVEFGTGQSASTYLATVDPEWRSLAQLYYINGKGTIINQPYVYPAFMKYKEQMIKDFKQLIKDFAKR